MGRKKNKGASQLNESQSNKIKECAELELSRALINFIEYVAWLIQTVPRMLKEYFVFDHL